MKRKILISILIFVILLIIIITYISNNVIVVSKYCIKYDNLPSNFDGYVIVQLSDFHSREFGKDNKKLIEKIKKQSPNIIVVTGDMINAKDNNYDTFLNIAKKLVSICSVYYIIGNHEQDISEDKLNELYNSLNDIGVNILDNSKVIIERDGQTIDVYGMWFNLKYYSDKTSEFIQNNSSDYYFSLDKMNKVLGDNSSNFSVLLTHNPMYFDTYANWGADLTLSGHIHGGMIRLPFLRGVYSPERTFFPKYDSGLFTKENKSMIVSRGIGNGNLGFRFLNCPEIVTITLKKK
jgi:predicted MPP superfamily phosphohydrolase